jgi:hypothetical protein
MRERTDCARPRKDLSVQEGAEESFSRLMHINVRIEAFT